MPKKNSILDNNLLNQIINTAADGIMVINEGNLIKYCNPAVEKIFGYKPDELIDMPLDILTHNILGKKNSLVSDYSRYRKSSVVGEKRDIEGMRKNGEIIKLYIGISKVKSKFGYNLIAILQDVTERKKTERKLNHELSCDHLTGLNNSKSLNAILLQSIIRAERYKLNFAIFFLDLNNFKKVNDKFGHAVGNLILKRVAGILKKSLRKSDSVARIGGDEFAIVIEGVKEKLQCEAVAKKIIEKIDKAHVINKQKINIGISIGIAIYPKCGKNVKNILRTADRAMYKAKKSKKSCHVFS